MMHLIENNSVESAQASLFLINKSKPAMNQENYRWIKSSIIEDLPQNAVYGGLQNKDAIYVGRISHADDILPTELNPTKRTARAAYGGKEILATSYEVLVGTNFSWTNDSMGNVPSAAVVGGKTIQGESLYIGRTTNTADSIVGKIHKRHQCLFISYEGCEYAYPQFEVLVELKNENSAENTGYRWTEGYVNVDILPFNSIKCGTDMYNNPIVVGRISHLGDVLPAQVIPDKKLALASYDGKEIQSSAYEILICDHCSWVTAAINSFPEEAIVGGEANGNEPLYIGRTVHTATSIGKIHPSEGGLYIPYQGGEYKHAHYEVLTMGQNYSNIIDHRWIATSKFNNLPLNAVYAGSDSNKNATYVGRFSYADNILPAKVVPMKKTAFAAYEGKEISAVSYEVLVGNDYSWVNEMNGRVPSEAFVGGQTSQGEVLYIGRAMHNGALTVGKIQPSHRCLYVPDAGKDYSYSQYEVLIQFDDEDSIEMPSTNISMLCCICKENNATMKAIKCGHLCFCRKCCVHYREKLCPVCRKPVSSWAKAYDQ